MIHGCRPPGLALARGRDADMLRPRTVHACSCAAVAIELPAMHAWGCRQLHRLYCSCINSIRASALLSASANRPGQIDRRRPGQPAPSGARGSMQCMHAWWLRRRCSSCWASGWLPWYDDGDGCLCVRARVSARPRSRCMHVARGPVGRGRSVLLPSPSPALRCRSPPGSSSSEGCSRGQGCAVLLRVLGRARGLTGSASCSLLLHYTTLHYTTQKPPPRHTCMHGDWRARSSCQPSLVRVPQQLQARTLIACPRRYGWPWRPADPAAGMMMMMVMDHVSS